MRNGRSALALAVALLVGGVYGCSGGGGGAPPPPGNDGGLDAGRTDGATPDGATPGDAGGMDAARPDGATPDGSSPMDSGFHPPMFDAEPPQPDGAFIVDGGVPDGFTLVDGNPFLDGANPMPDASGPCAAGSCPAGSSCLSGRCQPAGSGCLTSSDCGPGSTCVSGPFGGVCQHSGGGCGDSRDCPAGFACEGSTCVDRRIGCDNDTAPCPVGFVCLTPRNGGSPFCARASQPCANDEACLYQICVDVTGNGTLQCQGQGSCTTNADCSAAGDVCGVVPGSVAACQTQGPCDSSADCASGYECRDLWGDGLQDCVPSGGSCSSSADCAANAICGSPQLGDPPECVSRPL